jgi:hypothetical protein
LRQKKKLFTKRGIAMYSKRSYPVSTAFLLIFFILFSTSGSAYAAALAWNTFLGGTGAEWSNVIAVDSSGNSYVCCHGDDWGSPVRAYSAGGDTCVAKLSDNGTLLWNTFLGSSGQDYGDTIAVNAAGKIFMAGYSDATWGSSVRAYTADQDIFIAKILMPPPVQAVNIVVANTEVVQAGISWTRGSGE